MDGLYLIFIQVNSDVLQRFSVKFTTLLSVIVAFQK